MSDIISGISSVLSMFGSVLTFITGQPLLFALVLIPLCAGLVALLTSFFKG